MRFVRTLASILLLGSTVFGAGPASGQDDIWPMKAHDARRTGQGAVNGPISIDESRSWTTAVPGAHTINIGATVTETGAIYGSWGLLRGDPDDPDRRRWDKSDGQVYGLDIATGEHLWRGPLDLDLVPRCYDYPGRGGNLLWCGLTPYEVSYYNGTVEGQPAFDPGRNALYVGRGDGKLYAVDATRGDILWRYDTFNPLVVDDPDGGGEIVTAPLLDEDGIVYFGTWGEGPYETNAFYAVDGNGVLRWRYPSEESLAHRFFASPALSPDGATIYAATFYDDDQILPGALLAFHRHVAGLDTDETRLKWALPLEDDGDVVHTTTLAVGSDGTIYVGGYALGESATVPILTAVRDDGTHGTFAWTDPYVRFLDGAELLLGIALREIVGETQHLYATTSNFRRLFAPSEEGVLYALDLSSGDVLADYAPVDDVPAAIGGLNSPAIGADGIIYFGVQGRLGSDGRPGHYFAVEYDAGDPGFLKRWHVQVDGYVEWNHPAIGPDGGLYVASSSFRDDVRGATHDEGVTPAGSTAWLHALKGPSTSVSIDAPGTILSPLGLGAPYPNPFSASAQTEIHLRTPANVLLDVYDLLGRRVRTLLRGTYPSGRHGVTWDGTDDAGAALPGGVYVMKLTSPGLPPTPRTVTLVR